MIYNKDGKEIAKVLDNDGREIETIYEGSTGKIVYTSKMNMTGSAPLYFSSREKDLDEYVIYGNTWLIDTPTGVGEYDEVSGQYAIVVGISHEEDSSTTSIYLGDSPLMKGEYLSYREQKIYKYVDGALVATDPVSPFPALRPYNGNNAMRFANVIQPLKVYLEGKIKPINYGDLRDARDVYIKDKNGTAIQIQGE